MSITSIQNQANSSLAGALSTQGSTSSQQSYQGNTAASGNLSGSTTIYHGGQQGQGYLGGGLYGGYQTTPYYGYTAPAVVIDPDIALRKVENGWIVKMQGKEYVLTGTDQVEKYLKLFEEMK
jgi:hypothetical protein